MTIVRRAAIAVVVLLVLAGGVFGVRSVLGSGSDSQEVAAPNTVPTTTSPTPTPSPTPSATPTPTPSADEEEEEPEPTPTPTRATPTPTPTRAAPPARTTRATGAVRAEIKSALDGRGEPTSVWCPPTVQAAVGTTFGCTIAYSSDPAVVIADAQVRITTADGQFTWRSVSRG